MLRRFSQVDCFTPSAYHGNPCAVVLDGDGLDTERMQRFAHWMNLSETTFVLPPTEPDADYRVRIFTPVAELPFAGHPTIGTCHAWLEGGGTPVAGDEIVQECGIGLVHIRRTPDGLGFAAPSLIRSGPVEESLIGQIAETLGIERRAIIDAQWADNGPGWVAVLLEDADAVLASSRASRISTSGWSARIRPAARPRSRCAPSSPRTARWSRILSPAV
jgi:PhzF family phenazine biosynthesis protein